MISTAALAEILESVDGFIQSQACSKVPRGVVPPEVLDLERDELAQQTRIKLWKALQVREVKNIKAYINVIIIHEVVNMVRKYRRSVPFPSDD